MRTPTPIAVAFAAVVAFAALAACDKARPVPGTTGTESGCSSCHGSQANAAPPQDTAGASTGVKVGAHQAHLAKASLRSAALGCADCHVVPTSAPHSSGTVDMSWGALASTGGLTPAPGNLGGDALTAWEAAPTCTNYCHGAGFAAAVKGSTATPSWTGTAATSTSCGSCHQAPPATSSHTSVTASTDCGSCHAGYACTTANLGACTVDKATHLNGTVETPALGCNACHGSASTNAAPPLDTAGASTGVKVGAHQAHLVKSTLRAAALDCSDCHTVPTSIPHASGTVDMTWGALARTGVPAPTPGNLTGAARASWEAAPTCTNYCHGSGFAAAVRGSATTPSWTGTAATSTTCGSCHRAPPATAEHASVTATTNCGTCHTGYSCTTADPGACTVNKAAHLNGAVDSPVLGCVSCHGSADNAAPPVDTAGGSSGVRIGAHQAHLVKANLRSVVLTCADCHTVPTSTAHASGTVDMTWSALARTGGLTPAPGNLGGAARTAWEASPTCTNYCHGAGFDAAHAGTGTRPSWTGAAVATACGSCHKAPPTSSAHASVTSSTSCGACHAGYACTSGNLGACTVNKATHLNGSLDAVSLTCTSCHGDSTQTATAAAPLHAAPPADADGLSSGGTKIGAHQKHLTSTTYTSAGLACTTCHPSVGSYTASHSNDTSDVAFTSAPSANLRNGSWSAGAPGSCASTWCHGAVTNPNGGGASGGTLTTPTWTGTISGCTACHAVDMGSLTNMHRREHTGYACSICHGSGYSRTSVNKATHLDGVRTIVTVSSGTGVRTFSNGNCTASCHGSENWYR